jgi:hypothetical protein
MSMNLLRGLPEALSSGTGFLYFSVENTQVAKLPDWAHTNIDAAMYLHSTPSWGKQQGDVVDRLLMACASRNS